MSTDKFFNYLTLFLFFITIGLLIHSLILTDELEGRLSTLEHRIENPQTRIIPLK